MFCVGTGLIETLGQNWQQIASSAFFKKLLVKIIKIAGKSSGLMWKKWWEAKDRHHV
ncbi:hypothetical protein [Chitinophaga pinensis]|uniref:hypothetical protein n=1 Tax=Chitinophaga pinensis TaxID=79329 RepID=UPI00164568BC|nr:hypothetical protein [Chitinophaga pinensis]